jgi:glycosyltransferase involved in cell wall biosynthesis
MTMRLSVVIATFNRRDVLQQTLLRLTAQSLAPERFEVVVVDDGSTDGTSKMVEQVQEAVSYHLRYLHHGNRGPGHTQNVGIRAARHPLVLLLADDIWPSRGLLEGHLRGHESNPNDRIGVLGKVEQSPDLPETALHRRWDPFQYRRFEGRERLEGIYFHACNVSLKRDFLLRNGLFREHRGAAHEDIELGYRLSQRGLEFAYVPEALGYHYHPETLDGICRRAYERGLNFGVLSDNVPREVVFPLYKIATLEAGARAFLSVLPREMLRLPLFNRWTVGAFWIPVLRRAETSRIARTLAAGASYRGVAGYYLRAGCRESRRRARLREAPAQAAGSCVAEGTRSNMDRAEASRNVIGFEFQDRKH